MNSEKNRRSLNNSDFFSEISLKLQMKEKYEILIKNWF